jgi:hypothetical protein
MGIPLASVIDQEERNRVVDRILESVAGETQRAAADRLARYGFTPGTLQRWRVLRAAGQDVPLPRGDIRDGLLLWIRDRQRPATNGNAEPSLPSAPNNSGPESWIRSLISRDRLRQLAATPDGRAAIKALRGVIVDLPDWPDEKKKQADRLLTDALLNAEPDAPSDDS